MELFIQAAGAVLLASVLTLTLGKQGKEMSVLLVIFVCTGVMLVAVSYLRPVMAFLEQLESMSQISGEMIGILLKVTGIGILTEIAELVCGDAGNASLSKALQSLGTAVILWLCIPVFQALMELIQGILGGL